MEGDDLQAFWLRHEYRHFAQNPLLAAAAPLVEHIEVTVCVSQMVHCYIVKYNAIIRKHCFRLLEHIFVPKYPKLEFDFANGCFNGNPDSGFQLW